MSEGEEENEGKWIGRGRVWRGGKGKGEGMTRLEMTERCVIEVRG